MQSEMCIYATKNEFEGLKNKIAGLTPLEKFNYMDIRIKKNFKEVEEKILPLASRLEAQNLVHELKENMQRKIAHFTYKKEFTETRDKILQKIETNLESLNHMKKSFIDLSSKVGSHSTFLPTLATV